MVGQKRQLIAILESRTLNDLKNSLVVILKKRMTRQGKLFGWNSKVILMVNVKFRADYDKPEYRTYSDVNLYL